MCWGVNHKGMLRHICGASRRFRTGQVLHGYPQTAKPASVRPYLLLSYLLLSYLLLSYLLLSHLLLLPYLPLRPCLLFPNALRR